MAKEMRSKTRSNVDGDQKAWALDQLTKSEFFHQKLHEWGLLATAAKIEKTKGETLDWNVNSLGVSRKAWDKVIHRGIKPVVVFAHPAVLTSISGSVAYYRMLAMVSQKSMNRVRLSVTAYEAGRDNPDDETALTIAKHFNQIISRLVEFDEQTEAREFDLWRGMAAGSQAQGSWQNTKGSRIDAIIKGLIQRRLREKGLVAKEDDGGQRMELRDGRLVVFADEPDVAVYEGKQIQAAMEIKGGIDAAGVLERIGAALKSLRRVRDENPRSTTILLRQSVSVTETARRDLEINREAVTDWLAIEDILEDDRKREQIFKLLRI